MQAVARSAASLAGRPVARVPIVGTSLDDIDDEGFRRLAHDACKDFGHVDASDDEWKRFAGKLSYTPTRRVLAGG